MNKALFYLGFGLFLLASGHVAQAQIYKHTDANGKVTYSNMPIKGAVKLDIEPVPPAGDTPQPERPRRAKAQSPADFPRVDRKTQAQRDDKRQQILQSELDIEQKALEEAQRAYEEGKAKPEVYRGANGRTFRNVAKYQEKMQRLQADVDLHKGNIELLRKELAALD